MKRNKLNLGFIVAFLVFTLCSAIPVSKENVVPLSPQKIQTLESKFDKFSTDGKLSYHELKDLATTVKGEKLTLKEKIALKLFGKKISKKALENHADGDGKSQLIALLLAIILGIGIHRFYLGYTWQGIVQLLTLGGCGIWTLIDIIRICTGDLKPKGGEYGKKL